MVAKKKAKPAAKKAAAKKPAAFRFESYCSCLLWLRIHFTPRPQTLVSSKLRLRDSPEKINTLYLLTDRRQKINERGFSQCPGIDHREKD